MILGGYRGVGRYILRLGGGGLSFEMLFFKKYLLLQ